MVVTLPRIYPESHRLSLNDNRIFYCVCHIPSQQAQDTSRTTYANTFTHISQTPYLRDLHQHVHPRFPNPSLYSLSPRPIPTQRHFSAQPPVEGNQLRYYSAFRAPSVIPQFKYQLDLLVSLRT